MEKLKQVIVSSGVQMFCRLQYYLTPERNTKKDLILLSFIDTLIDDDCRYTFLDDNTRRMVERVSQKIINSNANIKHYR